MQRANVLCRKKMQACQTQMDTCGCAPPPSGAKAARLPAQAEESRPGEGGAAGASAEVAVHPEFSHALLKGGDGAITMRDIELSTAQLRELQSRRDKYAVNAPQRISVPPALQRAVAAEDQHCSSAELLAAGARGSWHGEIYRVDRPRRCYMRIFDQDEATKCLHGRRVAFAEAQLLLNLLCDGSGKWQARRLLDLKRTALQPLAQLPCRTQCSVKEC